MSQRTILEVESSSTTAEKTIRPGTVGTRAPEGAITGALMCIMVVGSFGWLAGIGVLTIPGINAITTAGPGLAALCGIVVGATVGGIAGCLVGRRIPELPGPPSPEDDKFIISVRARDIREAARAGKIMNSAGAISISVPDIPRDLPSPTNPL